MVQKVAGSNRRSSSRRLENSVNPAMSGHFSESGTYKTASRERWAPPFI